MALRQHSNEAMVETLTVARHEIPDGGEARLTTRSTTGGRERRAIRLPWSGGENPLRTIVLLVRRTSPVCFRLL